jgi:hypothetical protein
VTTPQPANSLDERIARLAEAAPPLTDEQRARLSALLRPTTSVPATTRRPTAADQDRKAA